MVAGASARSDTDRSADETISLDRGESRSLILTVGDRVDRYVVLDTLGAGGMGVVYLAYDPTLDRKVALKLLHAGHRAELEGQQRMLREAQALAKLAHPNVVVVHEVGATADTLYLAMEHVPGDTLRVWLLGRHPWREVVRVFVAVGRGLAAAHAAGVVHRDFKPSNVLMGEDTTRPRVVDFGLARGPSVSVSITDGQPSALVASGEPLTQAGVVMGTPRYMAPEQHRGESGEATCDQYAFCVALFEGLYGRAPFLEEDLTALHAAKLAPLTAAPAPGVPARLHKLIVRGLSPRPIDRFATMDALLDELRKLAKPRRRANVAAAAGLTVLGAASGWLVLSPTEDACAAGAERIAAVWSEPTQGAVAQAFAAGSPALGSSTWTRLQPVLDGYAQSWAASHRDACEATQVRHEQSPALMDQRMQCLDERLRALRALVRAYADADADTVRGALVTAEQLPRVERCSDRQYVQAQVRPPEAPEVGREVERLRDLIADADAVGATGHFGPALEALDVAREGVHRTGYEPLRVEHALAYARHVAAAGRYAEAETLLQDVVVAARRLRAPRLTTAAELALIGVMHRLDRPREALQLARLTEADAEHDGDLELQSRVLGQRGTILSVQAQHADALDALERALQLVQRVAPDSLAVAEAHASLGSALHRSGEPTRARAEQERALQLATARMGPRHPDVAASLSNLAVYRHDTGDLPGALEDLDTALSIAREILGPSHPKTAEYLDNKSSMLGASGRDEEALVLLDEVLAIRLEHFGPRSRKVAKTYNNIAVAQYALGRHDESIATFRKSLEIRLETLGEDHPETINALGNLGGMLAQAGDLEEAAPLLERALAGHIERVGEDHPDVMAARSNLARLRLSQGRVDEAHAIGEQLLVSARRALPEVHVGWAPVWRTRGMIAVEQGRWGDAVAEHERELAAATATGQAFDIELAQGNLAEVRASAAR